MSIHHPRLQHPKGMLTSRDFFPASWITWFIVGHAPKLMSIDSVHLKRCDAVVWDQIGLQRIGKFHRPLSALEARKERSCHSYSASHIT